MFEELHEEIRRALVAEGQATEIIAELDASNLPEEIASEIEAAGLDLSAKLQRRSKGMLRDRRRRAAGFQRRNFRRWRPAFDQIDILWEVAEEIGREFDSAFRPRAVLEQDYLFEALTTLHGRGLLVGAEAIQLMKGGFADGALARWRTLHELLVVAMFIRAHGSVVAHRYLSSAEFERKSAAVRLNQYAERAKLEPFSDEQIRVFTERCELIQRELGGEMKEEYGWANPAFPALKPKAKVLFRDLEASIGLDHWRPRYQWASQHLHAGHQDRRALLGTSETQRDLILVGASNSGLVDPLQMTALHIGSLTATLLGTHVTVDTLVMSRCIMHLADQVGALAAEAEQITADRHRKKTERKRSMKTEEG